MTVNLIRRASEKMLQLDEGFYLSDSHWKSESKRIIKDEMVPNSNALYVGAMLTPTRRSNMQAQVPQV